MKPRVYYLTRSTGSVVIPRLEKLDLEPVLFDSPREFVEAIENTPPLLCFMDLEMPTSKQGVRFFQSLQSHFRKNFPMILFASQIKGPLESIVNQLGAVAIFPPNADLDALARAVAPYLSTPSIAALAGNRSTSMSHGEMRSILDGNASFEAFFVSVPLQAIFEYFGPKLTLLDRNFEFSRDSTERMEFYVNRLGDREAGFISMVQNMSKSSSSVEDLRDVRSCIRFLSIRHTRNWIIDQVVFGRTGNHPYASRCEDYFGEDSRYGRHAFVCGFLYDLFLQYSRTRPKTHTRIKALLEFSLNQALSLADKSYEKARSQGNVELELYLLVFQLLRPLGDILIGIESPEHLDFIEKAIKSGLPPLALHEWERKHVGVSGSQLSATLSLFAPGLREAFTPLLLQFAQPLLASSDTRHFSLVQVCQEAIANEP